MLHISEADLLDDDHPYSSPFHASSFHSYPIVPQEVTELTVDACSLDYLNLPILTKTCSENISVKNISICVALLKALAGIWCLEASKYKSHFQKKSFVESTYRMLGNN